jgi:putative transposase
MEENSSKLSVMKMCAILSIKRSSYYGWLKRADSKRKKEKIDLVEKIRRIHKESYKTYGQRRIKKQLKKVINIYFGILTILMKTELHKE